MAQELRIIRGDTYDIICSIVDENSDPVPILGNWNVAITSETINKNSVSDPGDFIIEAQGYSTGQVVIGLTSTDTNPSLPCGRDGIRRLHYKIQLYKDDNPAVVKTVSTGDLIIIEEL